MLNLPSVMKQNADTNTKYSFPMSKFVSDDPNLFVVNKAIAMVRNHHELQLSSLLCCHCRYHLCDNYNLLTIYQLACQAVDTWANNEENLSDSLQALHRNHFRAMFQARLLQPPQSSLTFAYRFC